MQKNILLTVLISLFSLLIIGCSSYVIYCYGMYDNKLNNKILEYYNTFKFEELYEYYELKDDKYLKKSSFKSVTDLMYNKINLGKIYDLYYEETKYYDSKDVFIDKYYYGYNDVDLKNVSFVYDGKTTLFSRRKALIEGIEVQNSLEEKSYLGVLKNINFIVDENSTLEIDGQKIECVDNKCLIDNLFGGVHSLFYSVKGFTYYSILNLNESNMNINVKELDNLVTIDEQKNNVDESIDKLLENQSVRKSLDNGIYGLSKCMKSSGCPSVRYTYITLNSDMTCRYYFYISLDKAGDTYDGRYEISNGFLNLYFDSHTYSVFDYDTKEKTDIEANTDVKMTFKINDDGSFSNQEYIFVKKA